MGIPEKLTPDALYRRCDPDLFDFDTTADLEDGTGIVGQSRAVASIEFAVGMKDEGYNLFALGPPGTGKQFIVEHFLARDAEKRPTPPDLCYINNFLNPNRPKLLQLRPGSALRLKRDMDALIEEISTALPAAFEGDEYQARLHALQQEFKERHEKRLEELQTRARTMGFTMLQTPTGMVFAPLKEGEVLTQESFNELPKTEKERLDKGIEELQQDRQVILRHLPRWEREARTRIRELNQEITELALGHLIEELRDDYADFPDVLSYLDAVREDLVQHAREFVQGQDPKLAQAGSNPQEGSPMARRYQINVLIDNTELEGAPVVYEDHPGYENLIGRMEHIAHMGTLLTDFSLIRPGALHRANGGYLLLDARRVLMQPHAWEALKRVLQSRQIKIESLGQALSMISTISLEPEPLPIDVKIILLGDRMIYYLLCQNDPDFGALFKVAADFNDRLKRDAETQRVYARLIGALVRRDELRPFDRGAVSRVIEHSARVVGDAERLSGRISAVKDLLKEANYWSGVAENEIVRATDVDQAINSHVYRVDRVREQLQEEVLRGTINIDTEGARVGQINGLAVLQLGRFSFGKPSRITARIRLGKGEVVDIEREVEMSGPSHSKGVLILSSFLGARYATDHPLSLSASLVFEQSYSGVDGDSASSTELYALLSAISGVPIKQSLAVTGSVNQHGEVQAIGGANEKIEGFFDLCKARGLTGEQGVMIPASNAKHLMLRKDVVEAAAAGQFHVYAVETIDQGIELLTGVPAGERDKAGNFDAGGINDQVQKRLRKMAETQAAFARSVESGEKEL
jgi:lon-related putative ATP-dependent protease